MRYYYRAITQDGKKLDGFIDSRDVKDAARALKKHQMTPVEIRPPKVSSIGKLFSFLKRSSTKELIFFTRQMASMLASGLTLMQSLVILKDQLNSPVMTSTMEGIVADVENGKSFSSAIEKHPEIFSPIYISLIRTGESSGLLDKVLLRLADTLEKQEKLRQTIRSALLYPIIVVVMMVVVTAIMMIFVIPQLNSLYQSLNVELPIQTLIVVAISNFVSQFWLLVIVLIVLGVYLFRKWYKKDSGRRIVDKYLLKLPIFGKLMAQTMMTEFTRTFSLLIGSGSLVVDSLNKSADVVGNIHYKDAIHLVAKRVEKGIAVSDAMEASSFFPAYVIQMARIGEQTGKLDESFLKASEYYEREVDQTVKTLTTLLEPIIMVLLAIGVGFLIFAVITPIYSILSTIQ